MSAARFYAIAKSVEDVARELSNARVRYAMEWQFARAKCATDLAATHMATEKTKDEITILQARLKILETELEGESLDDESA